LTDKKNQPIALIEDNDAVIFFNFREDRARQITRAFVLPEFDSFVREKILNNLMFVTFTEYESHVPTVVAFQPQHVHDPLGWILSESGIRQLRIAETEKYAHVTYFFNGGAEEPYKNEKHVLIQSPKVRTYDMKPEMSAPEVTKKLLEEIQSKKHDFHLVNYANPDMVGHTGNLQAAIKAVEFVDDCVKQVTDLVRGMGGISLVTADHGNVEVMINPITKEIDKEHSTNPVPLILVDENRRAAKSKETLIIQQQQINSSGILADVAPCVLEILGITQPSNMTGRSLLNDLT
jgi:2,3-bisphosphoglycerate-independent phosphoglycerate mutase